MAMTKRLSIFFIIIFIFVSKIYGQNPPEEFFTGLDLMKSNESLAKIQFMKAITKEPSFHGAYHFLGVILLNENKKDSAIGYFIKSIDLNKENINHTKEMTYVRLIDTYLMVYDYAKSFDTALEAVNLFPENQPIMQSLKDACLWSFYIKHNGLDAAYLTQEMQKEYVVNYVEEEYLILRKIRIDGRYLVLKEQRLSKKNGSYYDILQCYLSKTENTVEVNFKLNWDLNKEPGGNVVDPQNIYKNDTYPIYERIGALLVSDAKIDLMKEIDKLMKK